MKKQSKQNTTKWLSNILNRKRKLIFLYFEEYSTICLVTFNMCFYFAAFFSTNMNKTDVWISLIND